MLYKPKSTCLIKYNNHNSILDFKKFVYCGFNFLEVWLELIFAIKNVLSRRITLFTSGIF